MSLLCSCYKCKQSTPFDRPCESCGFENPVFPDTIENVASVFLKKHATAEPPAPAVQIPPPTVAPPPPPPPPPTSNAPLPAANPTRTAPKLGPPFAVFVHPFLGLSAAALLGHTLRVDDFVERLIYYCAAGIVLLVDMLMLAVEAGRIASYCRDHPICRIANALATLPVCIVLVMMGVDEMTVGFALLQGGWFVALWGLKSLGVGFVLTLFGVGFGVYACELLVNKVLIGSPREQKP